MEEAGKHFPLLSALVFPLHVHRNVLKQRKDANQVSPVLSTFPQTVLIPLKESIATLALKTDNPANKKAVALIANGQHKTKNLDLLRKRNRLFPRVGLIVMSLHFVLTFVAQNRAEKLIHG
jgi:hypothetical protein